MISGIAKAGLLALLKGQPAYEPGDDSGFKSLQVCPFLVYDALEGCLLIWLCIEDLWQDVSCWSKLVQCRRRLAWKVHREERTDCHKILEASQSCLNITKQHSAVQCWLHVGRELLAVSRNASSRFVKSLKLRGLGAPWPCFHFQLLVVFPLALFLLSSFRPGERLCRANELLLDCRIENESAVTREPSSDTWNEFCSPADSEGVKE